MRVCLRCKEREVTGNSKICDLCRKAKKHRNPLTEYRCVICGEKILAYRKVTVCSEEECKKAKNVLAQQKWVREHPIEARRVAKKHSATYRKKHPEVEPAYRKSHPEKYRVNSQRYRDKIQSMQDRPMD
jgi:hypothetical protein